MSIDKIHKLFENKGCAIGCFGVMALMFLVSFINYSPQCQVPRNELTGSEISAAKVAGLDVKSNAIEFSSSLIESNRGAEIASPSERVAILSNAIGSVIDSAYVQALAKAEGVAATPESAEQALPSIWKQQLDQQTMFLEMTGQIKAGATEAQIAEALKKQGIDLPAQKQQFEEHFKQRIQDPASQLAVLAEVSQRSLLEKYAAGKVVTEEEVKAGFDTYQFKRILLAETGAEGKRKADALLAELKGGASFERLMERNSIDKPFGKEKLRDRLDPINSQMLKLDPRYKPLQGAKPGEVKGPIELTGEGTAIYKLIRVDRNLPPDYDKKRGEYRDGYVKSLARVDLQEKLDALKKSTPPVWSAKGVQALYEYSKLTTDADAPTGAPKKERLQELLTQAKASLEAEDPVDSRAAALATYAIQDELWRTATPAERSAMRASRIEALELALRDSESVAIRLEIVDVAAEIGDRARASGQLLAAAQANVDPSAAGQSNYYLIAAKLSQLKKKGLISAEDEAKVEAEQARWRTDREAMLKGEAEQKKQEEALRKQQEAEKKQFEEAARKAREEAKKNPPKAIDRADLPKAGG